MGILNVTPDSFSDGGRYLKPSWAVSQAWKMAEEGADLIDIGGESSRPGAEPVDQSVEIERIIPVIKTLVAGGFSLPISVDSYKPEVVGPALDCGAGMVNDITALRNGPELAALAVRYKVPLIIMHMRGIPRNMQQSLSPESSLVEEILEFFKEAAAKAEAAGLEDIIIDPGIGFGKTLRQNLGILRDLDRFEVLGYPLLIGVSRKSFIGTVLDLPVTQRDVGTMAIVSQAFLKGANVFRVHNVKMARQTLDMLKAVNYSS